MTTDSTALQTEIEILKRRIADLEGQLQQQSYAGLGVCAEEDLFSHGPVVIFKWLNADDWPVEFVSSNVEGVVGYSQSDFLDRRVTYGDILLQEDRERVESELAKHKARGASQLVHEPYRVVRKDQKVIWLMDHTVYMRDDDGNITHYVGYVYDISDRIEAEKRWMFALEGARDGVWDWDATTNKVFFSDQWKRMLGHEPDEVGDTLDEWESRVHPDDLESAYADLVPHLEGKTPYYENIHRVRCKDGSYKWILDRGKVISRDGDGNPLRVIGTHSGLTEYKTAEEELKKARQHVTDILDKTTDAFFEIDNDFRMTHINKRAQRILRLSESNALGENLWDIFPDAVDTIFYHEYIRAAETQQVAEFDAFFEPLDTWFEVHAYPTPYSLSVYFQDITERKRREIERNQIFNLSLDMICVAGFDGYLKKINPAWERALGWTEEDLTARPWLSFVHPDDRDVTIEVGAQLLKGKRIHQFENRYLCKDGSCKWLSWNSVPVTEEGRIYAVVRDVTERRKAQDALAASEDRFRFLVENAPVGMAMTDKSFNVLFINPAFSEMTGYTLEDFSTVSEWHYLTLPDAKAIKFNKMAIKYMREAHKNKEVPPTIIQEVRCKDLSIKVIQMQYVPIEDRGVTLFVDITEQKRLEEELTLLANTDELTGVFNRRHFIHVAQEEFVRFKRYGHAFAFLMLDLDHFKNVNDTYGHDAGDEVLRVFAKTVESALRDIDIFGRLGGEEFALVLPETGLKPATAVARRLRKQIEQLVVRYGTEKLRFTVSIGIAVPVSADEAVESVMRRADEALYEAKKAGRNRVAAH